MIKMKRRIIAALVLILMSSGVFAQVSPEILPADIGYYIKFLASDSLKGRKPGTPEAEVAASFIQQGFKNSGLTLLGENGYQKFEIVADIVLGKDNHMSFEGADYQVEKDFIPLSFSSSAELEANVVFAGYGFDIQNDSLQWNDYKGIDPKNKWVLIFRGDPEPDKSNSAFATHADMRAKVTLAKDKGASGVIFITPNDLEKEDVLIKLDYDKSPAHSGVPVINITRVVADKILESMNYSVADLESSIKANKQPINFSLPVVLNAKADVERKKVNAVNVVGSIEGKDKDHFIVIGAHYDHLGYGGPGSGSRTPEEYAVHNGADDNASGVAGVLELAGKLAAEKDKPNMSIIFIAFSGEELGLLGSKEFTREPLVPLKSIKAMINLDMIGRLDNENKGVNIGGTGTSVETDTILAIISAKSNLKIAKSPDGYGPSDHASFYSENIPVFFFTTGAHEDYHTPADDYIKINLDGEKDVLNYVYALVKELENRNCSLTFREAGSKQNVRYSRNMKVTMGIIPDMVSSENNGLRIDGTKKGGPAESAGLIKGDRIISINGNQVTNIYDYMTRLGDLKPGDRANVEAMRGEQKLVFIVQF